MLSYGAQTLAFLGFLDPDKLLQSVGLLGLLGIVFAECGLLVGFFLPGDTLLFTAGVLVANDSKYLPNNLALVCFLVSVAAVAGNLCGYAIGRKAGPAVFRRPGSRLFDPDYVTRTQAFFDRWGAASIVLARFVPVVRTFITVMAGVGRMRWRTYVLYSTLGGVLWGTGVVLLGYWLGQVAFIADHVELILIGGVAVSVVPVTWALLHGRRATATSDDADKAEADPAVRDPRS
jgi:membrane-associated protein